MLSLNDLTGAKWGNIMLDEVNALPTTLVRPKVRTRSRSRARLIVPKDASAEAKAYGRGEISFHMTPRCKKGAECSDNACTFFHGAKECEFHAGLKKDERRRLPGGKPNPQFGKPMPCGKGSSCTFNHRSKTRRDKTEKAIYVRARKQQAPILKSEADLFAAYPTLEWLAGDSYRTNKMSALECSCFELSLKKSGWDFEEHADFWTVKIPHDSRSKGSRAGTGTGTRSRKNLKN
jgi:hypothetical protein